VNVPGSHRSTRGTISLVSVVLFFAIGFLFLVTALFSFPGAVGCYFGYYCVPQGCCPLG